MIDTHNYSNYTSDALRGKKVIGVYFSAVGRDMYVMNIGRQCICSHQLFLLLTTAIYRKLPDSRHFRLRFRLLNHHLRLVRAMSIYPRTDIVL
jgi:hypothetical protein